MVSGNPSDARTPLPVLLQGKIKSLEQIYLFSMPVKEYQIVEYFLGSALKDEVMKIMPVQKQTRAGQRTRFKVQGGSSGSGPCMGAWTWDTLMRSWPEPSAESTVLAFAGFRRCR